MPRSDGSTETLPPIAALFLVVFDQRVGYKVAWKESIPDVQLEGVVEYKSLPSGLHNVESDLIYFTHDKYAGLSAFLSRSADESERNAHFVAVGILLPLSYGRLGRAWMHAQGLQELAESVIDDITDVGKLQKFWNKHRLGSVNDELRAEALSEPSSPVGTRFSVSHERKTHRRRGLSDAAGFSRAHVLSQSHPALSMPRFLDTFGPLTFPIYRAALLRKRILLVGSAPVQQSCDFVYDLSIFSNVPPSLTDVLPTPNSLLRIRPLFNVGIHDIPELGKKKEDDSAAAVLEDEGWLACTTDDILATKPQLYDYLVQLPPSQPDESAPKAWPTICTSDGKAVKATQRDLRRYAALRKGLRHMQNHKRRDQIYTDDESTVGDDNEDDTEPLVISTILEQNEDETEGGPLEGESTLVEPASWASIAYSSFLWWASAGEKDAMLADEDSLDSGLLEDLDLATSRRRSSSRGSGKDKRSSTGSRSSIPTDPDDVQGMAMVLIAYFHRLTSAMMETLSGLVAAADDETEDGVAEEVILIESDEVRRMGLDVWSNADKQFLQEVVQLYFERDAEVRSINVECCGIKIC